MSKTNQYIQDHIDSETTDSLWNRFRSDLCAAVDKYIPHKIKIRRLLRTRKRLFRKCKRASKDNREHMESKLRSLKHKIRRESRTAYWNYVESIILPASPEEPFRDTKKLWSFIKHRKTDSVGVAPLKDKGALWDSPRNKAEISECAI